MLSTSLTRAFAQTLSVLLLTVSLIGCGDDDGVADAGNDGSAPDAALDATTDTTGDALAVDAPGMSCELPAPPTRECTPVDTDYAPRADDMWDACVSDEGEYVRIEETISSIQRIAAFEEIVALLAGSDADRYIQARTIYQQAEGLDSRVVRRYDPRVTVPEGTDCTLDGVPEMFPDYCIGPAVIQPILLDSFAEGDADGGNVAAARIEAALLRFFYVSVFKEATTCTTTAKDCDSSYAYYTGGEAARGGIGLAADVAEAAPSAHDRVWDGLLGLRCWRDLDSADVAVDLVQRDQALDQIDRALSDGVAAMIRARLTSFCTGGDTSDADWAYVSTLGPALLLSAQTRDAAAATELETQFAQTAEDVDVSALVGALDTLFPCP